MAFCPNCGKTVKKGFCEECKPSEALNVREIVVKICCECMKYSRKNAWISSEDLEKAIEIISKDKIKEKNVIIKPKLPTFKKAPGVRVLFEIEVEKKSNLYVLPAELNFTYCDRCAKKQGQYFEGTLQLRKVNEEILDFVETYIKTNNISIANKTETEDGYDLDISDQRKLQSIGHQLKKKFGGNLKISVRQFTQNRLTSKQVYRVNALYEAPEYKKGDIIKLDNKLYLLTNVRNTISAIDLRSGKKGSIDIKNKEYIVLSLQKTKVSKIYPKLEVFDPETYQSVYVENKKEVKIGEKVDIVNDNGLFYIV